jgi:hypothetical protein
MYILRYRGSPILPDRDNRLETGQIDETFLYHNKHGKSVLTNQYLRFSFVVATIFTITALGVIAIATERNEVYEEIARIGALKTDSPCLHFRKNLIRVIVVPDLRLVMVSPKIISFSSSMVMAYETFDVDSKCPGVTIQRERHAALAARYGHIDMWPFGAKRTTALTDEHAVCVQHAMDDFEGKLKCELELS